MFIALSYSIYRGTFKINAQIKAESKRFHKKDLVITMSPLIMIRENDIQKFLEYIDVMDTSKFKGERY